MRWIFLTLVFGNLLLLTYFWQQQGTPTAAPIAAVDLPIGGKKIQLISELDSSLPTIVKNAPIKERTPQCYMAGPYTNESAARNLLERISAQGLAANLKNVQVAGAEPSEYWVYVAPRPSREEALRTLRELQNRKFDSYIITQGELADGISLGLFRNAESAYKLQKATEAVGIVSQVQVMNKTQQEFWVEVRDTAELNDALRERVQGNDKDIRWELLECN
ncbi:MAG: hypothetical protein RL217_1398 [Pseudomonadota bacterium]|jgi:cell division septation protein DedD